ncbi:ABC transporter ATP-binding protein [Nocardioides houyundeii]|uniref:ABC transporter ATP-binding protein n=1 Tax=Nocardioides houyundeii TaxID=2045452 RepID=UPI001962A492|nr:ABC transporter ATP-binding protein [Nocardioides houyundeii]
MLAEVVVPGRVTAHLQAGPGEVVAVIGPNGAGKSTLLHALAGLVPMTGQVLVDGTDWASLPVPARELGVVFQDRSLFPHLSACDNVAFGLRARGVPRRVADATALEWLERFGVTELARRRPGQLSGGQAQRVAIARALACRPRLLLLDEPFAGLDVTVAAALRLELAEHLAGFSGVTLLVTHDALDALTLASRVVVIDGGTVAQTGTPRQVAAQPRTEHVARLVGINVVRDGTELVAFSPTAVTVSLARPEGSARLSWHGAVSTLTPHGDALRVQVASSPPLLADVTPESARELALAPGRPVWLSAKATAVRRYPAGNPSHERQSRHGSPTGDR